MKRTLPKLFGFEHCEVLLQDTLESNLFTMTASDLKEEGAAKIDSIMRFPTNIGLTSVAVTWHKIIPVNNINKELRF